MSSNKIWILYKKKSIKGYKSFNKKIGITRLDNIRNKVFNTSKTIFCWTSNEYYLYSNSTSK